MSIEVIERVRDFLSGRIWLRLHTPFSKATMDHYIESGHIETMPGITTKTRWGGWKHHQCNRCGNTNQARFTTFHCALCEGNCTYCRHCLQMGRVSSCTELITWRGDPPLFSTEHRIAWQGQLTPLQQQASEQLMASIQAKRSHLIHAVCGSGKTEMLFQPIAQCLMEGKRVCIAAPRVDVILELAPRLQAAFPKTPLQALYGGAEPTLQAAQLILATTHQLFRFQQAFDVIFVDEADAFPYSMDETLQKAVQKAVTPNGSIHYVTATPSDRLVKQMKRHGAITTIARRYHGFPLPLPRKVPLWHYEKQIQKGKLPTALMQWTTERLTTGEPFLIFFHQIDLMERALPLFQQIDNRIQAVHAAHPERKTHVKAMRDKTIPGLLTTTILERGITIPNVQVAVVGAEQPLFTKEALIQIGGRVGRSAQHPTGDFVLFHHGISYAMDEATEELLQLNKRGGFHE